MHNEKADEDTSKCISVPTRPIPALPADDIALSPDFNAHAFIVKSDKDGLWEKTLVVHFQQKRRRLLSTNDGILDVLAAGQPTRRTQCFGTLPAGP